MKSLQITVAVAEADLLKVAQPHIDAEVRVRTAALQRRVDAERERVKLRDQAFDRAVNNVVRASARVDASRNSRDEQPSLQHLIAAAGGLRRLVENKRKGL